MMNWNKQYKYYYWGPLLYHTKVDDKFCDEMNTRGRKLNNDYRYELAGHIDKESQFLLEDRKYFVENTQSIFESYKDMYINYIGEYDYNKFFKNKKFDMYDLWINIMKPGETNPIHIHSGDLSFVLFTQMPDEIIKENEQYAGSGLGPGTIQFLYGQAQEHFATNKHFLPRKGDFFIFPAKLYHMVYPFKSNVERISIAGNINFIDK